MRDYRAGVSGVAKCDVIVLAVIRDVTGSHVVVPQYVAHHIASIPNFASDEAL